MKCPVCTAEIPSTAKFCGGCGATITPPKPPKPPKPAAAPPKVAPAPELPAPVVPPISPRPDAGLPGNVERKYKALRLIAMLYKVLAFVSGGGCVLMALYLIVSSFTSKPESTLAIGPDPTAIFGGAIGGLVLLVLGSFLFIFLYGLGEWMYVFMDIEENTRKTNELLASKARQATS